MKKLLSIFLLLFATTTLVFANAPAPYGATPSKATLQWHQYECFGIIHYGPNTYEGKQWGYGDANPKIFNPGHLDTDQWCKIAKEAGLKGLILVAKHHDGFCLWPTKTTDYNISASPWKNGNGNLVDDFVNSCKKYGLKAGLYVSPWDRNNKHYATPKYVEIYHQQWKELISKYGDDIFEVWFDGANGGDGYYGGAKESRTIPKDYYQFDKLFKMILSYAPNTIFFGGTHDQSSRWVGNEDGIGGTTNWCTYNPKSNTYGLSERLVLPQGVEGADLWVPAEADVPIYTPKRWFFDERVRPYTLPEMMDIYYQTVGRNCSLNLGLAPTKDGLFAPEDKELLLKFRKQVERDFANDLAKEATLTFSDNRKGFKQTELKAALTDDQLSTYWATNDGVNEATLTVTFNAPTAVNRLLLQENIELGQRVDSFTVKAQEENGQWKILANGTTIGYKRILRFKTITAQAIQITLKTKAPCLTLSKIGLYHAPKLMEAPVIKESSLGLITIRSQQKDKIYFAVGYQAFEEYRGPFRLRESARIRAYALDENGNKSDVVEFYSADPSIFWTSIKKNETTYKFSRLKAADLTGFFYQPKQDSNRRGLGLRYEIYSSDDGRNWSLIKKGAFENIVNNQTIQEIIFERPVTTKYIQLIIPESYNGNFQYEKIGFYN